MQICFEAKKKKTEIMKTYSTCDSYFWFLHNKEKLNTDPLLSEHKYTSWLKELSEEKYVRHTLIGLEQQSHIWSQICP